MEGLEARGTLVLSHDELREPAAIERLRELCGNARVEEAGLCSVVPSREDAVAQLVREAAGADLTAVRPAASSFFPSAYRSMETLGADRYCGALAARARYGAPVIVVDCGTATTVNVVDERGVYLGGVIAPGVETALRALGDRTAQLPNLELEKKITPLIGGSTEESMYAGAVHFSRFAVEGAVAAIKDKIGDKTPLILTGGNALILLAAGLLCDPQEYDEELLFRGVIFYLLFR